MNQIPLLQGRIPLKIGGKRPDLSITSVLVNCQCYNEHSIDPYQTLLSAYT